ncbi:hypothetical protein RRG08_058111 [Elysia crispata]|uniref:Uncharacterized protein n=1 Tax=Elysia crispata TaxID=231223 RepID=A0AAE1D7E2_9GAST|nr:hypothetical protein RRG08_058111 [Elysia crispata]
MKGKSGGCERPEHTAVPMSGQATTAVADFAQEEGRTTRKAPPSCIASSKEQNDDQVSFPSTTQCFVGTSTWDSAALQQMWVQLAPYTAAEL